MTWEFVLQVTVWALTALFIVMAVYGMVTTELDKRSARKVREIEAEAKHLEQARLYAKEGNDDSSETDARATRRRLR